MPVTMTGQARWRLRRAIVIGAAARAGVPQSWIADSFDLSCQRVSQIVRSLEKLDVREAEDGRDDTPEPEPVRTKKTP